MEAKNHKKSAFYRLLCDSFGNEHKDIVMPGIENIAFIPSSNYVSLFTDDQWDYSTMISNEDVKAENGYIIGCTLSVISHLRGTKREFRDDYVFTPNELERKYGIAFYDCLDYCITKRCWEEADEI